MSDVHLHLNPPFRAEHVGSLLRTPTLFKLRESSESGTCDPIALAKAEDEAIREAVIMQRSLGLRTFTDGELRRESFFDGVFENLKGMTFMPARPMSEWKTYMPHIAGMVAHGVPAASTFYCSGKIRRIRPFYLDQFKYTKSLVGPEEVKNIKINVCAPSWFHQRHGSDHTYDLDVYKNDDEYFDAIGEAYTAEFQELYYNGCRHIQIDDPTFCFFCNDQCVEGMRSAGVDPDTLLDTYIRAINVCTRNRPSDLTISVHMCRGNYKGGMHFTEGPYDRIGKKVFNNLDVDVLYLEYDTERSGDFQALRHLPQDKVVVLGLVSSKTPELEAISTLKTRVYEAVSVMADGNTGRTKEQALNQLCISPQCGFASVWQGNNVTIEDEKRKLELVVAAAKEIWDTA